jgi:hypothetical protein
MPDALGGMRSGKSTAWRGWTGCGITETLRALITLKRPQWSQRFQWESVGLASRPRLTERLNEGVTRKLTLVSAPAGFGKTTLLSEWASHFGSERRPASFTHRHRSR